MKPERFMILLSIILTACNRFGAPPATPIPAHTAIATVSPTRTLVPPPSPTYTATSTRTHRPSQTPTIVPTARPTAYPTLHPGAPAMGPEGYRLKPLTEGEMIAFMDTDAYIVQQYPNSILLTLGREFLLKSPMSTNRLSVAWRMASYLTNVRKGNWLLEPSFATLAEDALNRGQATPDRLGQWLKGYGFEIVTMLSANNLAGDGQPGWAIQVVADNPVDGSVGVFALTGEVGSYRLTQVYGWQLMWHGSFEMKVADYTGNGLPEIVVSSFWFCSGMPSCDVYNVYLYEWQPALKKFTNLAHHVSALDINGTDEIVYAVDFDTISPWQFSPPDEYGTQSIIAPLTAHNCHPLDYRIVYSWNGRQYQWSGEGYLPMDSLPSKECQIIAALVRGKQEPELLPTLGDILENWSPAYEETWGLAGKDYLRLQLGILQALNGYPDEALQTLRGVRDQPENMQFQMVSKLAKTFLTSYTTAQSFTACRETVEYLNKALEEEIQFASTTNFYLHESMQNAWGFYESRWKRNGNAVCSLETAFRQSLSIQKPQTDQELSTWLDGAGVLHTPVQVADINGDGAEDWLIVARLADGAAWQAWSILRDGFALTPIPTTSFYFPEGENLPKHVTLHTLRPDPALPPVVILTYSDRLSVFQLLYSDSYRINHLQSIYDIDHVAVDAIRQNWTLFKAPLSSGYDNEPMEIVYHWDSYLQDYAASEAELSTQDQAILRVERLLFEEAQFSAAADALGFLLSGEIVEGNPEHPEIRPYLIYLLGLAYELQESETRAVQAYWQLWRDFPENPYTQLARAKLY
ncbi:MAG: hypothetical protein ACOYYS_02765 [Chloroflexota bacterium]